MTRFTITECERLMAIAGALCAAPDPRSLDREVLNGVRSLIKCDDAMMERKMQFNPMNYHRNRRQLTGTTNASKPIAVIILTRCSGEFTQRESALLSLVLRDFERAQTRLGCMSERVGLDLDCATEDQFHDWLHQRTDWKLSRRESDVVFWLSKGKRNDEIGQILGIAGRTAETHALNAYPKMGVENRYAAIAALNQLAMKSRVIALPRAAAVAA